MHKSDQSWVPDLSWGCEHGPAGEQTWWSTQRPMGCRMFYCMTRGHGHHFKGKWKLHGVGSGYTERLEHQCICLTLALNLKYGPVQCAWIRCAMRGDGIVWPKLLRFHEQRDHWMSEELLNYNIFNIIVHVKSESPKINIQVRMKLSYQLSSKCSQRTVNQW